MKSPGKGFPAGALTPERSLLPVELQGLPKLVLRLIDMLDGPYPVPAEVARGVHQTMLRAREVAQGSADLRVTLRGPGRRGDAEGEPQEEDPDQNHDAPPSH